MERTTTAYLNLINKTIESYTLYDASACMENNQIVCTTELDGSTATITEELDYYQVNYKVDDCGTITVLGTGK